MKFKKHIFICTNQRNDPNRKSCGEECGMTLVKAFKKALKDKNLKSDMRAQRAGCRDACDFSRRAARGVERPRGAVARRQGRRRGGLAEDRHRNHAGHRRLDHDSDEARQGFPGR